MKRVLSLALLLTLASFSWGQVPPPKNELPKPKFELKLPKELSSYVLKVQTPTGWGSGCAVSPRRKDGKYDVLTAAHVVGNIGSKATVSTSQGASYTATVMSVDHKADVAWLLTDRNDMHLPMLSLARNPPGIGSPIRHQGLGGRGILRRGFLRNLFGSRLEMSIQAVSGDSGGPVVCERSGEIVGVQSTNLNPRRLDMFGNLDPPFDSTAGACDAAWRCRPGEGVSVPLPSPVFVERPRVITNPVIVSPPSYVVPPRIIYQSPPVIITPLNGGR